LRQIRKEKKLVEGVSCSCKKKKQGTGHKNKSNDNITGALKKSILNQA
jgi:hypothetical protein